MDPAACGPLSMSQSVSLAQGCTAFRIWGVGCRVEVLGVGFRVYSLGFGFESFEL